MRRRLPRSLAGQLALLHAVTAVMAVATLPVGAIVLHQIEHRYQREVLQQQARSIAALLLHAPPRQAIEAVDVVAGGLTLSVVDRGRHAIAQRGPARPAIVAGVALDRAERILRQGPLTAISLPAGKQWVIVSQDDTAPEVVTDDVVSTFLARFALLLLPLMLLGPLAGIALTRRLTRRLTAASDIAAAIGPQTLDRRLPQGTLPGEVEPLATATNAALDRLEQAFAAQAAFAADVAHELRTPLATIRLRADVVDNAVQRQALLAGVDRAARVVTQLLVLAELERPIDDARDPVHLSAIAAAVVGDRAAAIIAGGRHIALDDAGAPPIPGYAAAITLALENLIDNATLHTPPGTCITVQVGPGSVLTVADDGAPISPAAMARMTKRFWRGDARRHEGFGLGLSIVARVADAHGGALHLTPRALGNGLVARLVFGGAGATERASHSAILKGPARA